MQLIDLVSKYIRALKREQRHAHRTIISYESDLRLFSRFAGETRTLEDITEQLVERYFRALVEKRRMSSATVSRKLSVLRGFFKYLELNDYIPRSPLSRLPLKTSICRSAPLYMKPEEITPFFRAIDTEINILRQNLNRRLDRGDPYRLAEYQLFCSLRNKMMFLIILHSGIRSTELVRTHRDHVRLDRDSCIMYPDRQSVYYYEIGDPETLKLIREYLHMVKQLNLRSSYFIFNRDTGRLSTVMVQRIFKSILKQSTVKRPLTPSSLRHAYAISLIKNKVDINTIRNKLGYKSFDGLLIYREFIDNLPRKQQKLRF